MMNIERKHLLLVAVVSMIALAGCAGAEDATDSEVSEDIEGDVASEEAIGTTFWTEAGFTESNQQTLVQAQPPVTFERSLERENLIRRYGHLNDADEEHHVYLVSEDAKVINYDVAQGKVSSVNSKLTNDKQIVRSNDCLSEAAADGDGSCYFAVESPQLDGSYGTNGNAIFYFTVGGEYVETNLDYIVSSQPKDIQTEVTLVDKVEG